MTRILSSASLLLLASTLLGCPDGAPGGPFGSGGAGGGGGQDGERPGFTLDEDTVGPDGCPLVTLDPSAWAPLSAMYTGGADPFFHLHTNEDVLFVGLELYTVYGAGWTGQQGTFEPDCGANGLCAYLVPDGETVTRAEAGAVDVVALSQVDGVLQRPAEVVLRDLTFVGTEDAGTCFHVAEVTLAVR